MEDIVEDGVVDIVVLCVVCVFYFVGSIDVACSILVRVCVLGGCAVFVCVSVYSVVCVSIVCVSLPLCCVCVVFVLCLCVFVSQIEDTHSWGEYRGWVLRDLCTELLAQ